MNTLALLALCAAHEPTPDDVHRFGLPLVPALRDGDASMVRATWRLAVSRRAHAVHLWNRYGAAGVEPEHYGEAYWNAMFVEAAWYWMDDLADADRPAEIRLNAARQLRCLLGPVDYYQGKLPQP